MTADATRDLIEVREHGCNGTEVIVLHGGPGAAGDAGPLARALAADFRVLEPWQRSSGPQPLTVARHVTDLAAVVATRCRSVDPALVGHSWGAMLALAYAAEHPKRAGPIVLVGCGTFDARGRSRLRDTLAARTPPALARKLERLAIEGPDTDQELARRLELVLPLYSYDPDPALGADPGSVRFDARAHRETWDDMLRLQRDGVYPAAFAAIRSPVLMLHGSHDPHPGRLVHASLEPHVRDLEYRELPACGHYPWCERRARAAFLALVREWLAARASAGP